MIAHMSRPPGKCTRTKLFFENPPHLPVTLKRFLFCPHLVHWSLWERSHLSDQRAEVVPACILRVFGGTFVPNSNGFDFSCPFIQAPKNMVCTVLLVLIVLSTHLFRPQNFSRISSFSLQVCLAHLHVDVRLPALQPPGFATAACRRLCLLRFKTKLYVVNIHFRAHHWANRENCVHRISQ